MSFLKCMMYSWLFHMMGSLDESSSLWVYKNEGQVSSQIEGLYMESWLSSDGNEACFISSSFNPAGKVLVSLWTCLNSSFLSACPPVNIIEGLEWFLMSPVCAFWVNLQPCLPSAWFFLVHTLSFSSVPLLCSPCPPSCPSLLIPLNSASFEEVRLLSA